ncbi:MAG: cation:proton antiporter [Actinomycetota bacterium]
MDTSRVLSLLALVYIGGRIGGWVAERLKQPPVVGEIVFGVLLGPAVLAWVPSHDTALEALSELGLIFLMFTVGLETDLSAMRRSARSAVGVAIGGMVVPFVLGWGYMQLTGANDLEALFLGTALVATSVGVTARILGDLGKLSTDFARTILGAAVIDDILSLLLLAVVSGSATGPSSIAAIGLIAITFVLVVTVGGRAIVKRVREPSMAVAIAVALLLAAVSSRVGLAAIIGAFLAGVVFADVPNIRGKFLPLVTLLVPFFFVHIGTLIQPGPILTIAAVTAIAIVGKFFGSALPAMRSGFANASMIGVGMIPRGEVGIIVAQLGLSLGVIDTELFGVVVVMSVVTTLVTPPLLTALAKRAA